MMQPGDRFFRITTQHGHSWSKAHDAKDCKRMVPRDIEDAHDIRMVTDEDGVRWVRVETCCGERPILLKWPDGVNGYVPSRNGDV